MSNKYKSFFKITVTLLVFVIFDSLKAQEKSIGKTKHKQESAVTAAMILGNPNYLAFSYGGYRQSSREKEATIKELQEDLKIMAAMGIKIIRTYNTQQYSQAANLLEAIRQLKKKDKTFEMYVMLGTWIDCEGAWSSSVNHNLENEVNNKAEVEAAVEMTKKYPDIVKIIAIGNESMVHWATSYFVSPKVILKWVDYLQKLKAAGELPSSLWITSSDNYASWGGGDKSYKTKDLEALIKAVDYVSLHMYPFHDTFYKSSFWVVPETESGFSDKDKIDAAMLRAKDFAVAQYQSAADYIKSLGIKKPIHIGETGWATKDNSIFGNTGTKAADEYKEKLYYNLIRDWSNKAGMSCFYFEVFDEQWKDLKNSSGSENHFGLIDKGGKAKYALWEMVDKDVFKGLSRNGVAITKTFNGDEENLFQSILPPFSINEVSLLETKTVNKTRKSGELVTEDNYIIVHQSIVPSATNSKDTYPSGVLKLNSWEGTCGIIMNAEGMITVTTGTGNWWGCSFELQAGGVGEDLSRFKDGFLHFDIKGNTTSVFKIGFQTGVFSEGTQVNNFVIFGADKVYSVKEDWITYSIPVSYFNNGGNLKDVTGMFSLMGDSNFDGKQILLKNIFFSTK